METNRASAGTTLLISATVFEDQTRIAYSLHDADRAGSGAFSPISQCEATEDAWAYLTGTLPDAIGIDAVRISVIDRRPGARATSRAAGVAL
jgi:hypothetical protein